MPNLWTHINRLLDNGDRVAGARSLFFVDRNQNAHARPTPRASFSLYRYHDRLFTVASLGNTRVDRRTQTARHHARRPPDVPIITTSTTTAAA